MCWLKVISFWQSGVTFTTFLGRTALEAILRWVSWVYITGCYLVAFSAGKGERLGVNGSSVCSDYKSFSGHGHLGENRVAGIKGIVVQNKNRYICLGWEVQASPVVGGAIDTLPT